MFVMTALSGFHASKDVLVLPSDRVSLGFGQATRNFCLTFECAS